MHRIALFTIAFVAQAVFAQAEDIPGSADHPLVGRFETAFINAYDRRDFDEYGFPTGVLKRNSSEGLLSIEGVVTRIAYTAPAENTIAEVARNFELALADKGFEILFKCKTKECGGGDFAYGIETFPIPRMAVNTSDFRYVGAKLVQQDGGDVYATVLISNDNYKKIRYQVTVVETEALANKMIDAKAIADSFAEKGSVALYGIYFDTDKADVKPESAPTLEQMAAFLNSNPDLTVIIVGHTDNQGAMDYNLSLSHRRAQAVAAALTSLYGIGRNRLQAAGAGFLAPVAPNVTDQGRALNRRVEMIPR